MLHLSFTPLSNKAVCADADKESTLLVAKTEKQKTNQKKKKENLVAGLFVTPSLQPSSSLSGPNQQRRSVSTGRQRR